MGKTHKSHKNAKGPAPQLRSRNTRSSKGRLLTDTSFSSTQLKTQLSLLGLYASPTIGDGNCLFRALSDQIYGSPSRHPELRQQICDHIAKHKSRYEPFVEDDRGLDVHLRAMRENATYGGHMELSAFAHMARRNIKVIQPGLVYVIEWNAGGGWEESGSSLAVNEQAGSSTTSKRISRRPANSGSPTKAKEETKIKLGKGYYVYEEFTTSNDEEDESGSPIVYVAYHDWEHFSSIRNLLGPHTGLPNIVETPPPPIDDSEQRTTPREMEKDRERERKKDRERKEKERKGKGREGKSGEKEKKTEMEMSGTSLKVKLKLSPSSANASVDTPIVPSSSSSSSTLTPADSSTGEFQPLHDPSLIPLPVSRSASPFVGSSSSLVPSSAPSPLPSSSLANEVYPEDSSPIGHISTLGLGPGHRHPHAHILQTPRSQYRSPKRTFDESSASGGEENPENSKRSRRRRVGSTDLTGPSLDGTVDAPNVGNAVEGDSVKVEVGEVVDIVMHVDVGGQADQADTPSLSVPGSSSSSPLSSLASSVASSVSGEESEVDMDDEVEIESQVDDPDYDDDDDETTAKLPLSPKSPTAVIMPEGLGKVARQKYLHRVNHAGGKPLTRRQRKMLGLPKPKKGIVGNVNSFGGTASLSAGKIVIPGGKWKGRDEQTPMVPALPQADGEWTRNGSGRLDVRGFRELKI